MAPRELVVAEEAARAAGDIIRAFYAGPYQVREKSRDNPVTEADLRANECIRERIRSSFPGDGWLSEETWDSPERLSCRRVWIVDPLDGTKEFIQHIPELAVCIALVEDGEPIIGVSFNPITDELFSGGRGVPLLRNGVRAHVSDVAELSQARILASRSEDARGEWEAYKSQMRVTLTGSVAYKLALIAAGLGDATFSLTPKHEWDICAGAMLITAGGGRMSDCDGRPLRFNNPKPLVPGIIATNTRLYDPIRALIARTRRVESRESTVKSRD